MSFQLRAMKLQTIPTRMLQNMLCVFFLAWCARVGLPSWAAAGNHPVPNDRAPKFALRNPIAQPDSGVIIAALNRAAKRKQPLHVEFEGLLLEGAARLLPVAGGEMCWHF